MSKTERKTNLLVISISKNQLIQKPNRADRILADLDALPSRSQLKRWFAEGRIQRSGQALKPDSILSENDEIHIQIPGPRRYELEPRALDLQIHFEDESLLVLYKPKGLSMHPGAAFDDETTLVHGLIHHSDQLSKGSDAFRPGIVHRLDKDTEGLVVVAKTEKVHEALANQFQKRSIQRKYWALCWGKTPAQFTVEAPIGRHPQNRKKMAVVSSGKAAKTDFELKRYFDEDDFSWLECKLHTGRTHQIRVHLSHKKFPIINDAVYCRVRDFKPASQREGLLNEFKGQALIAFCLGFIHPITQKELYFEAQAPRWFKSLTSVKL